MAERKNAKALACSSLQERTNVNLDVPLQGRSALPALFTVAPSILLRNRRVLDSPLVLLVSLKQAHIHQHMLSGPSALPTAQS